MLQFKDLFKTNNKLLNFITFSFFALAFILLWTAITKEKETYAPSSLFILFILICAVVTIITLFKHFYANYATRQGSVWDNKVKRFKIKEVYKDIVNVIVILYVILLFFYIVLLIYITICNPKIPINQSMITMFGSLTESIHNHVLTGLAFILNIAIEIFASVSLAVVAFIISGSKSFKQFRILVAILFAIAFFMGEAVVIDLVMNLIVDTLGGIEKIYSAIPNMAAFLILIIEMFLYALITVFNLIIIYKLIKQKEEQIEKVSLNTGGDY